MGGLWQTAGPNAQSRACCVQLLIKPAGLQGSFQAAP